MFHQQLAEQAKTYRHTSTVSARTDYAEFLGLQTGIDNYAEQKNESVTGNDLFLEYINEMLKPIKLFNHEGAEWIEFTETLIHSFKRGFDAGIRRASWKP